LIGNRAGSTVVAAMEGRMDLARIPALIEIASSPQGLAAAQAVARKKHKPFPTNGCAYNLSALLMAAGIDVRMTGGAGRLATALSKRGWTPVEVGDQLAGDVGVTVDANDRAGPDHIYLVIESIDGDRMLIADNQAATVHERRASGRGRTRTSYFLRASGR
jgi:hypothetical protein